MKKPIIIIGGASGTGKSTLANHLLCRLNLDHHLGGGFVREIVKSETTAEKEPQLFSFTFSAPDPIAHLTWQAERLHKAIQACIDRARREGTSLVVEGSQLMPHLYKDAGADAYLVLTAPPDKEHYARLLGPSHTNRAISDSDWHNVQLINQHYIKEAQRYGIPAVTYDQNLGEIIALVT